MGLAIGFAGRIARVARVHQLDERAPVELRGPEYKYPARVLLDFSDEDREMIHNTLLAHFVKWTGRPGFLVDFGLRGATSIKEASGLGNVADQPIVFEEVAGRLYRHVFRGLLPLSRRSRAVCGPIREVAFFASGLKTPRSQFFKFPQGTEQVFEMSISKALDSIFSSNIFSTH